MKQNRRLLLLRSLLSKSADLTVFVGCGSGRELGLVDNGQVAGVDFSRRALEEARDNDERFSLVVGDALQLPFRDHIADQVVVSETLEHLPQPTQALNEIYRICTEGGKLVLTCPNELSLWGFARKALELIQRRQVTASNQPIDSWLTVGSLKALLADHFDLVSVQGAWYFPPLGKSETTIESKRLADAIERLIGLDILLGKSLPSLGHIVGVSATPLRPRKINEMS